jgi:hypothetical protein
MPTARKPGFERLGAMRDRATLAVFGLGVVSSLSLSACARVMPYERETLARPDMVFDSRSRLTAGEEHARAYREGSSGGGRAKGGGCGCN